MSHSYSHNPIHLVFSTKERRKIIPAATKPRLWAYLAAICKNNKIFVHEIGGMEDHVHMLIEIPLKLAFSDAIKEIKTGSSQWMGPRFNWQVGFGVFGGSESNVDKVIRYIRNQEIHHRKLSPRFHRGLPSRCASGAWVLCTWLIATKGVSSALEHNFVGHC